jgi:hypothetical protein
LNSREAQARALAAVEAAAVDFGYESAKAVPQTARDD